MKIDESPKKTIKYYESPQRTRSQSGIAQASIGLAGRNITVVPGLKHAWPEIHENLIKSMKINGNL